VSRRAPTRRQLRRLLLRAGFRVAPPPRQTFIAALAARLGAYGTAHLSGAAVLALPARARRQLPLIAGALVAMAVAVFTAVFSGWFGRGPGQHRLALAAAVDTTVVLPDGSSVAGRTGLELPNGTVVRTGPNGRASAGDVELDPRGAGGCRTPPGAHHR
jgi:hypothetical protein